MTLPTEPLALLVLLLRAAGAAQILLVVSHTVFPRVLRWREELSQLSPVNRQIFWVHTYFVVLTVALFGALSLIYPKALLTSRPLGPVLLGVLAVFWGFRLYCQFRVYEPICWRGNVARTIVHILFALLWACLTIIYTVAFVAAGLVFS